MRQARTRNYLNGMDWFAAALNHQCRFTPGRGQFFLVVFETEEPDLQGRVAALLQKMNGLLPLLNGRISRHALNLAPFWRMGSDEEISCSRVDLKSESAIDRVIQSFANVPLPPRSSLAVLTAQASTRSWVIFKFGHLLFDGRGAELFFDLLGRNPAELLSRQLVQRSPELSAWKEKLLSGKRVNETRRALLSDRRLATWKSGPVPAGEVRFKVIRFDESMTAAMVARSEEEVGPFMMTPFLGAAVCGALAERFEARGIDGDILMPMTTDLRGFGCPSDAIFFNHWSLSPLLIERGDAVDSRRAAAAIVRCLIQNVRSRYLMDLRESGLLWRIVPVPVFARYMGKLLRRDTGACLFSYLPESSLESGTLDGIGVRNLHHLPLVPPSPGLGVVFNRFSNRINGILSYWNGIVDDSDAEALAKGIFRRLTGGA